MKHQRGFNLVELAIVLVIIGLLLGGVLKGQALVTSAKIKRVNNDFNGITAAIYTYLDRYAALPGDDKKAVDRWGPATTTQHHAGNGNGTLGGVWNNNTQGAVTDAATEANETANMWAHLYKANLVSSMTPPLNAFNGKMGIQEGPSIVVGANTVPLSLSGIIVCMDGLTGDLAETIDINFDDGSPDKGLLRAVESTGSALATAYSEAAKYVVCKRI